MGSFSDHLLWFDFLASGGFRDDLSRNNESTFTSNSRRRRTDGFNMVSTSSFLTREIHDCNIQIGHVENRNHQAI